MSILRAFRRPAVERRWADTSRIPGVEQWYGEQGLSQSDAIHIAAIVSCVSLLADTISTLPSGVYVRQGQARVETDQPDWMRYPIASDPNVSWEDHLAQAIWSQELDGNIFTLALPSVFDPAEIYNVNPTRTVVRKRGVYELSMDGGGRETVGPDQMIHIARNRQAGELRGMSPVQEAGTTFAMKRAAERFAERVFNQGIFLSGALNLPGPASKDTIDQLKDELAEQYGGAAKAGKPGVFANGAKWEIPQLNLQEWQLVEIHKAAKLEAAGLWRVPPYLIGVVDQGAMAYASVEAQGTDLAKYSITPRTIRIEGGYRRLLADPRAFIRLNVNGLQRGDIKSRAEAYQFFVQNKIMRPAEVRALEDLAPDPEMTGYLETPNNNAPAPAAPEPRGMRAPILTSLAR